MAPAMIRYIIVQTILVFLILTVTANDNQVDWRGLLRVPSVSTTLAKEGRRETISLHTNQHGPFDYTSVFSQRDSLSQFLVRMDFPPSVNGTATIRKENNVLQTKKWIQDTLGYSLGEYVGQGVYIMRANVNQLKQQWQSNDRLRKVVVGQYRPEHKFLAEHFKVSTSGVNHLTAKKQMTMRSSLEQGMRAGDSAWDMMLKKQMQEKLKEKRHGVQSVVTEDGVRKRPNVDGVDEWRMVQMVDGERYLTLEVMLERSLPISMERTVLDRNGDRRRVRMRDMSSHVQPLVNQIDTALRTHRFSIAKHSRQVLAVSPHKIVVVAREKDALSVAQMLSTHHDIHWIEAKPRWETHNKWAKWVTQSNVKDSLPITKDRKITGEGEIIGVGDSGLDPYSCFFHDTKANVPFTDKPNKMESNHRKIGGYWGLIDQISEEDAHGTHVAGTILGKSSAQSATHLGPYNGISEDAKIIFTDIGCAKEGGCSCNGAPCECDIQYNRKCSASDNYVYLPLDLETGFFPFAYDNGARIHTNSWGGGAGVGYSISTMEIDRFAYEHKDFLILFSAGNSGGVYGYASLGTQAEAKNILSVGASMNTLDMFKTAADNKDYDELARAYGAQAAEALSCKEDSTCEKRTPEFLEECEYFSKNFTSEADCCGTKSFCKAPIFPLCGCDKFNLGMLCCKSCVLNRYQQSTSEMVYNQENLAYFSSRGPTVDLRIKPDIVAPGHSIFSAKSHNTARNRQVCGTVPANDLKQHLVSMGGTSMSCPLTAGASALVRQYFRDGYWSNGIKDASVSFNPSSALVRAMIINSGQQLKGYLQIDDNLVKVHGDKYMTLSAKLLEGHGRVQLDKVLAFNEEQDESVHTLIIPRQKGQFDQDPSLGEGSHHDYCFSVKDNGEFKATLTWTDFPSTPAAKIHLVNNLDLAVMNGNNDHWFGNSENMNTMERDEINNVEQVSLSKAKPGEYVVHVEGFSVPEGPQQYALAVTGTGVTGYECSSSNAFYDRINGKIDKVQLSSTLTVVMLASAAVVLALALMLLAFNLVFVMLLIKKWTSLRRENAKSNKEGFRMFDEQGSDDGDFIHKGDNELEVLQTPVVERELNNMEPGQAEDEKQNK